MKYLLYFVVFFTAKPADAQRMVLPFNKDWQFSKDNFSFNDTAARWQKITLPHTWNIADVMDDEPGYYRGIGSYRKKFSVDSKFKGKDIYLFFEGANQESVIFINGKKAGEHTGGYTAFNINLTPFLHFDKENELLVKVDNSHNKNIPPLTADFTFYGGIYRDVFLIAVDPVHFSFNNNGSKNVFITMPSVSKEKAAVIIRGNISNTNNKTGKIKVVTTVLDAKGRLVVNNSSDLVFGSAAEKTFEQSFFIPQPKLWSPENPYLYKVVTKITDGATGKVLDEITNPLGLRWYKFDAAKGFFLNDKPLKIIGASRHQDFKGMGNAVPDSLARKDVELLKAMGGNFLRVAHYPQDPSVLQACDELGILASVEIPVVNEITESDSFYNNCMQMQVEMIRQHFNHPSVIMWCYMNEILLRPSFSNDKERQKIYFSNIAMLAKKLDSITRKEDPYRPTMIAHHGNYNQYKEVGLIDIPMIVGWNLYQGWYGANIKDLPVYLDRFHKEYPAKPMMITEYGADADPRIHSTTPVRFDKSVEYATAFHQYYFKEIMQRPFVAGAMVWNLADFNSETRNETMPHINNKGLLEWDRTAKDPYYYYKAMLVKEPFVKILGSSLRGGIADSGSLVSAQKIQIAGNVNDIEVFLNDQKQSIIKTDNGIAELNVQFKNGNNIIEAKALQNGKRVSDKKIIDFQLQPYLFTDKGISFSQLNILVGAKRSFVDNEGLLWIPNQDYRKGSWGSVGGKPFKLPKGQLPYGTDKNIKGTNNDPVYQAQQTGISAFRLDVPDGDYELVLHFAELLGGKVEGMIYNLDAGGRTEAESKRIFTVLVNGRAVLENFNIAGQHGSTVGVRHQVNIRAENNTGIKITFQAVEGEPVLNALQLKKISGN